MYASVEQFKQQAVQIGLISQSDIQKVHESLPEDSRDNCEKLMHELVRQKRLTPYQAQVIYHGKGSSLLLGNYLIQAKLGQGGMGIVLKAQHRRMKRQVAIKVLTPSALKNLDAMKRFQREVEAAAKLQHPNIVISHDADEVEGTLFLVMEYVNGPDLSALVRKIGLLSVNDAICCVLQAARGLEYAHKNGVIHRDVKPANLLIDAEGVVKILDMGLARIEEPSEARSHLTATGFVVGTADYMAPEQALGTSHVDSRSDVYSLGYTLWHLLTGKPAYDGETPIAVLIAHRDQPTPRLSDQRSDVPECVEAVFQKMVAKEVANRYQTMTEVIQDLVECLPDRSMTVCPHLVRRFNELKANAAKELKELKESPSSLVPPELLRHTEDHSPTIGLADVPDPPTNLLPRSTNALAALALAAPVQSWWKDRRLHVATLGIAAVLALAAAVAYQFPEEQFNRAIGHSTQQATNQSRELQASPVIATTSLVTNEQPRAEPNHSRHDPQPEPAGSPLAAGVAYTQPNKNLMLSVNPSHDSVLGKWTSAGKHFEAVGIGQNHALRLPAKVGDSYSVQVGFSIDKGNFSIVVPIGSTGAEIGVVGGADVVLKIDGREWRTGLKGKKLPSRLDDGQRHDMVVQVTRLANGQIRIFAHVDGQNVFGIQAGADRLNYPSMIEFQDCPVVNAFLTDDGGACIYEAMLFVSGDVLQPAEKMDDSNLLRFPVDVERIRALQATWARQLQSDVEITNSIGTSLVLIPPGDFLMGASDEDHEILSQTSVDKERFTSIYSNERPRHPVRISRPFYAGKYEVTRAEFGRFVAETKYVTDTERLMNDGSGTPRPTWNSEPTPRNTDRLPVACLTWNDVRAFCVWLSGKEGEEYTLPTEAQAEYLCRAGLQDLWAGEERTLSDRAWIQRGPSEVGLKSPNAFGLFDIQGNVCEWCLDGFAEYSTDAVQDPQSPWSSPYCIIRGGSFRLPPHHVRPAKRGWVDRKTSQEDIGFRLIRVISRNSEQ